MGVQYCGGARRSTRCSSGRCRACRRACRVFFGLFPKIISLDDSALHGGKLEDFGVISVENACFTNPKNRSGLRKKISSKKTRRPFFPSYRGKTSRNRVVNRNTGKSSPPSRDRKGKPRTDEKQRDSTPGVRPNANATGIPSKRARKSPTREREREAHKATMSSVAKFLV